MTASIAPYVPKPPPSPKTRPKRSSSLAQLYAIQKSLFNSTQDEEIADAALAQVARAWSELEQLKLRIKMKPAPKPVDTTKLESEKRKAKSKASADTNFAEQ